MGAKLSKWLGLSPRIEGPKQVNQNRSISEVNDAVEAVNDQKTGETNRTNETPNTDVPTNVKKSAPQYNTGAEDNSSFSQDSQSDTNHSENNSQYRKQDTQLQQGGQEKEKEEHHDHLKSKKDVEVHQQSPTEPPTDLYSTEQERSGSKAPTESNDGKKSFEEKNLQVQLKPDIEPNSKVTEQDAPQVQIEPRGESYEGEQNVSKFSTEQDNLPSSPSKNQVLAQNSTGPQTSEEEGCDSQLKPKPGDEPNSKVMEQDAPQVPTDPKDSCSSSQASKQVSSKASTEPHGGQKSPEEENSDSQVQKKTDDEPNSKATEQHAPQASTEPEGDTKSREWEQKVPKVSINRNNDNGNITEIDGSVSHAPAMAPDNSKSHEVEPNLMKPSTEQQNPLSKLTMDQVASQSSSVPQDNKESSEETINDLHKLDEQSSQATDPAAKAQGESISQEEEQNTSQFSTEQDNLPSSPTISQVVTQDSTEPQDGHQPSKEEDSDSQVKPKPDDEPNSKATDQDAPQAPSEQQSDPKSPMGQNDSQATTEENVLPSNQVMKQIDSRPSTEQDATKPLEDSQLPTQRHDDPNVTATEDSEFHAPTKPHEDSSKGDKIPPTDDELELIREEFQKGLDFAVKKHKDILNALIDSKNPFTESQLTKYHEENKTMIVAGYEQVYYTPFQKLGFENIQQLFEERKKKLLSTLKTQLNVYKRKHEITIEKVTRMVKDCTIDADAYYDEQMKKFTFTTSNKDEFESYEKACHDKALTKFKELVVQKGLKADDFWQFELKDKLNENKAGFIDKYYVQDSTKPEDPASSMEVDETSEPHSAETDMNSPDTQDPQSNELTRNAETGPDKSTLSDGRNSMNEGGKEGNISAENYEVENPTKKVKLHLDDKTDTSPSTAIATNVLMQTEETTANSEITTESEYTEGENSFADINTKEILTTGSSDTETGQKQTLVVGEEINSPTVSTSTATSTSSEQVTVENKLAIENNDVPINGETASKPSTDSTNSAAPVSEQDQNQKTKDSRITGEESSS